MKKIAIFFCIATTTAAILIACSSPETKTATNHEGSASAGVSIERGRHLVLVGGCNDCHTPKIFTPQGPRLDTTKMLAGHIANSPLPNIDTASLRPGNWVHFAPDLTASVGPWGMTLAANLTSDSATGIGAWGEANFVKALRTGRHMGLEGGRPIMPPMPWENLKDMSEDDLKSIYAYLKSTPPVSNRVHEPYNPGEVVAMFKEQKNK